MITVEDLTIKVTYRVGLGKVQMPEKVYQQLLAAEEVWKDIDPAAYGSGYEEAAEWLTENIKEGDCMEWSATVEEISE